MRVEWPSVEEWRKQILEAWEKYGTGIPLDPATVEHLAEEFAKPWWELPKVEWPTKRRTLSEGGLDGTKFYGDLVSCEAMPMDTIAFITPRYNLPSGELDLEATAKASVVMTNVGKATK